MNNAIYYFILVLSLALFSCGSSKNIGTIEEVLMEEVVVTPEKEIPYKGTETRTNDLIHTKLEVSFDWAKRYLFGKATLDLEPYFYPTDELKLDAKGFEIKSITMSSDKNQALDYTYDGEHIFIDLARTYSNGEQYQLFIDYIAKPDELESGGSAAITSDKGLYFINPDGDKPDVPQQIWTQGETEASSCWFPTIDLPAEKTTQEIYITVQDRFKTLSNGDLISSTANDNGTRTDYWKQIESHTPYLFAMAIGEFEIIRDEPWNGKAVDYYVEPKYAPYAKKIFGNTKEMIEFYSEVLDYPYPWEKYSQVVVREFVSGAMENTSAVIFFDGLNRTDRELLDEDHEDIIAHELFHHWFGDIVTCESWANLPLNESFATYGEYLWIEYKYGLDEADEHIMNDLQNYLQEAQTKKEPLIRYYHDNKEDMFDGHSYQKGGRTLHTLRDLVGDDAFFASLSKYLKDNAFTDVEIHELRIAFEDVTGMDLNWFFDQWFFRAGHPVLDINYEYDEVAKKGKVMIKQIQEEDVYILPLQIDLYTDAGIVEYQVEIDSREFVFEYDNAKKPYLVNLDANKVLLGEKLDNHSTDEWIYQFNNANRFLDRYEAIEALAENEDDESKKVLLSALSDPHWAIREKAVNSIKITVGENEGMYAEKLSALAATDSKAAVRNNAVRKLGETENKNYANIFERATIDSAYSVNAAGLESLTIVDKVKGLQLAKSFEKSENGSILRALGRMYSEYGNKSQVSFFENAIDKKSGYTRYSLMPNYAKLLESEGIEDLSGPMKILGDIALDDPTWWVRLNATKSLINLTNGLDTKIAEGTDQALIDRLQTKLDSLTELIGAIKGKETFERLKAIYSTM